MRRIPACRKEFGLKLYRHVPRVHTLCLREPCVVEIERGEEALYPAAEKWDVRPRADDDTRRGGPAVPNVEPTWFRPEPMVTYGVSCDVVVCPRKRDYGSAKNWRWWPLVTEMLQDAGLSVFAAGAPDSSYEVSCPVAWDYERFLDASLEAIRSADLVLATDAGLAHLAVQCGVPLAMVTYRDGLVAPGPVLDADGEVLEEEYWPVKLHRYEQENHTGSPIHVLEYAWHDPDSVVERVA